MKVVLSHLFSTFWMIDPVIDLFSAIHRSSSLLLRFEIEDDDCEGKSFIRYFIFDDRSMLTIDSFFILHSRFDKQEIPRTDTKFKEVLPVPFFEDCWEDRSQILVRPIPGLPGKTSKTLIIQHAVDLSGKQFISCCCQIVRIESNRIESQFVSRCWR